MRVLSTTTALLLLSLASRVASECLTSLSPIFEAEQSLDDDSNLRLYVLCPETIFEVASSFRKDGTPRDGDHPLFLGRSNIHVLCGEDGRSENNCVLTDGLMQVGFFDKFDTNKTVINALVKGLTFTKARSYNVLAENYGNLTLSDCVFKDNRNMVAMLITDPELGFMDRRQLQADNRLRGAAEEERSLDQIQFDIHVTVSNCAFVNNTVWPYSGETIEGLVVSRGASLEITDTVFVDTKVDSEEETKLEFMVLNEDGLLTLRSNCFIGNSGPIAPVVNDNGAVIHSSNSVQRQTPEFPSTRCGFISHGSIDKDTFNASAFKCEAPDVPVCRAAALSKVSVPCLQSLNEMYEIEQNLESDSNTRTHILCPETEYQLRGISEGIDTSSNKSLPIIIGRSNVHILCGADGKSDNRCLLSGGSVQLGVYDEYRSDTGRSTDALVQGLTFTGATSVNILANMPSSVHINDCVFKNNVNLASIYIDRTDPFRRLEESRSAQGGDEINITVTDSLFIDNIIGTVPRRSSGVITNNNGTLRLHRNLFNGTTATPEEQQRVAPSDASFAAAITMPDGSNTFLGYVIANLNGYLEMESNCFINNEATLAPVISVLGELEVSRNGGTKLSGLPKPSCEFMAVIESDPETGRTELSSEMSFSCVQFDGETCSSADIKLRDQPNVDAYPQNGMTGDGQDGLLDPDAGILAAIVLAVLVGVVALAYMIYTFRPSQRLSMDPVY